MANALQSVTNFFRRFFIGGNSNKPTSQPYPFNIGSALNIYPDIDSQRAVELGFQQNATVFSIVKMTGMKAGSIARYVYLDHNTTDQKKSSANYLSKQAIAPYSTPYSTRANLNSPTIAALNNLLHRPNSYQGQDAFFAEVIQNYMISGEAFIWCNRGFQVDKNLTSYDLNDNPIDDSVLDKMPVLEMFIVSASIISLIPDPDDAWNIFGYVLNYGGYEVYLRKNDVIHWKNSSLCFDVQRSHLRGVSPLKAGGAILQQSTAAIHSATRMFQNDGARGLLYNTESADAIAPGQMDMARQVIDKRINSADVSGSVSMLAGSWGYLDLGKAVNMPMLDGQRYTDQQLCMLFSYPYELIQAETTFSNKSQALLGWTQNFLIPLCRQLDGEMNRILLKAFGLEGVVCIGSDFSQMPELQDHMVSQSQALSLAPYLTFNEKRIQMGFEPMPDPIYNQSWIPQGVMPMQNFIDELNQINTPLTPDYTNTNTNQDNAGVVPEHG